MSEEYCQLCGKAHSNEPPSVKEAIAMGVVLSCITKRGPGFDEAKALYDSTLARMLEAEKDTND